MSLGGGSKSTSKSGYSALSKELKAAFDPLGVAVGQYTNPANAGVIEMFTPMGQTAEETSALNMFRQGFTPTEQSLASDIQMQMNPYNQFVIDEINRQSSGQYSLLNQTMTDAGQLGSNRAMLGANDIDLSRTNQIGSFLQGQYNTALNNAMTTLPGLRQQDATNLMGAGSFLRGLDTQTRQAPITALQTGTQMISPFVSGGTSTTKESGGLGGLLDLAGNIGAAYITASDRQLKTDIEHIGQENGHNVYKFKYKDMPERTFIGVMADEVEKANPDAVHEIDGFKAVDYAKIGVEFREA